GVKVAVLGLTTGDIVSIVSRPRNEGVAVADPIAVAQILVPELRKKADLVVALTHLGVDEDRALARRVPGIDLIVGGHSHTFLWEPVLISNRNENGYDGTMIVQAGRWGERVGRGAIAVRPRARRPSRGGGHRRRPVPGASRRQHDRGGAAEGLAGPGPLRFHRRAFRKARVPSDLGGGGQGSARPRHGYKDRGARAGQQS